MTRGKNNKLLSISFAIALTIFFVYNQQVIAKEYQEYQEITIEPNNLTQTVESEFTISVLYNVSDNNKELSGIGVRVHYDSSKIEYKSFQNKKELAASPYLRDDNYNRDNDLKTDKYIFIIASKGTDTGWPGTDNDLPLKLVDLTFQMTSGFSEGITTTINVSETDSDGDYDFKSVNSTISVLTSQEVTQEIPLQRGWNLISFSVNKVFYLEGYKPSERLVLSNAEFVKVTSIDEVFESLSDNYFMIRDGYGKYHIPTITGFQQIKYIAGGLGYWIYMLQIEEGKDKLKITGKLADKSDFLYLDTGMHLVGCWDDRVRYRSVDPPDASLFPENLEPMYKLESGSITKIFDYIEGNYLFIKNNKSKYVLFNSEGAVIIDQIDYIGPGQAYWIYITNDNVIFHY